METTRQTKWVYECVATGKYLQGVKRAPSGALHDLKVREPCDAFRFSVRPIARAGYRPVKVQVITQVRVILQKARARR